MLIMRDGEDGLTYAQWLEDRMAEALASGELWMLDRAACHRAWNARP